MRPAQDVRLAIHGFIGGLTVSFALDCTRTCYRKGMVVWSYGPMLGLTAGVTVAMQLSFFFVAYTFQIDKGE